LDNFSLAISYFPNYTDAHISRAGFYIDYKKDYINAITDYDAITSNLTDEAPEKAGYYSQKAKWKVELNNLSGAIGDYSMAIIINPKSDTFNFERGKLFYNMNKYEDAQKDFNAAIKINLKYSNAYYYRGLNYVALKNIKNGGLDFSEAEKFGFTQEELSVVDSISNAFNLQAKEMLDKHNFIEADSLYDNALKIRNCNSNAFHGKAEIKFITANELTAIAVFAKAKQYYIYAIEMYRKAEKCFNDFSDAFYKEGLSHLKIGENDLAYNCFTEAIRCDQKNIQAYIERGNELQIFKKHLKACEDYEIAFNLLQSSYEIVKKGNDKVVLQSIVSDQSNVQQLNGQALFYSEQFSDALNKLNKAIELNENNAMAFYYRGLVFDAQNELSKANKDFNQAIKIMPDYRFYYANGLAYYKNKNYTAAISNINESVKLDSTMEIKGKNYLRGMCFYKLKEFNPALVDFESYSNTEEAKSDTLFYGDYGIIQLYANKDAEALRSFNRAITLNSNNGKALFGMACIYARSNDTEKVFEFIEKAFNTHDLNKKELKPLEEAFLSDFNKNKTNRNRYNDLKKLYLNN
jgi:tetratricopeptide (TPR) repeat protein